MRLIAADPEGAVEDPEPYGACSSVMEDVLVALEAPSWSPRMSSDSHARFAIGSPRRCLLRHARTRSSARSGSLFRPTWRRSGPLGVDRRAIWGGSSGHMGRIVGPPGADRQRCSR